MSRSAEITSADGLAIVGTTPDRVADVLGSVLDGGPSYLTGSLGTGLGNPGSDIDIVVFTDGAQQGELPMMFFVDEVILDVQFFAADSVADACRAASSSWAELPVGRCSRSAAPPARLQKRLSRWCTATPLLDQTLPSVVKDDERASVHAALVRGALNRPQPSPRWPASPPSVTGVCIGNEPDVSSARSPPADGAISSSGTSG